MPKPRSEVSLKPCVPVSTQGAQRPKHETNALPVGRNALHEARLITSLCDYYGWTLCTDGNLYNPNPSNTALRSHAA